MGQQSLLHYFITHLVSDVERKADTAGRILATAPIDTLGWVGIWTVPALLLKDSRQQHTYTDVAQRHIFFPKQRVTIYFTLSADMGFMWDSLGNLSLS